MKSTNPHSIHPQHLQRARALRRASSADTPASPAPAGPAGPIRTTARDYDNPVDYQHPYESMARLTRELALRYDANRTRHAYYRQLRLLHEHGP